MKLWILRPAGDESPWKPWYDKCFGLVVRAKNEQQAREIAAKETQSYSWEHIKGGSAYLHAEHSSCEPLSPKGQTGVIIKDNRQA